MCIVESSHDEIIGIEDYFLDVCFFEMDFFPWENPLDCLLFDALAVSIDELSKFSLILELEDFQSLWNWKFRVGLFCAFGNFKSDSLWDSVQESVEVIKGTFLF